MEQGVSSRVDFLMKVTHTSNAQLARALNFDASYISRIRSGKRGLPPELPFIELAAAFFARNVREAYQADAAELCELLLQSDEGTAWMYEDPAFAAEWAESMAGLADLLETLSGGAWAACGTPGQRCTPYAWSSGLLRYFAFMSELKKHRPDLHSFFVRAYQRSFMSSLCDEDGENLIDTCTGDAWTKFQYLMYLRCSSERACLEESQYYQAFFGRVTSLLRKARKGRASWVGDKKKLKEEYIAYPEADAIINRAFDLRNSNPLVHASSQALDSPAPIVDFQQSVRCLKGLLSKRLRYGENGESAE